jgi:hypothetical protein
MGFQKLDPFHIQPHKGGGGAWGGVQLIGVFNDENTTQFGAVLMLRTILNMGAGVMLEAVSMLKV